MLECSHSDETALNVIELRRKYAACCPRFATRSYEILAYGPDGTPFDFKHLTSQTLTEKYSYDKSSAGTDAALVLTAVNIFTEQKDALTARPQISNDLSAIDNPGIIKANLDGAGRYVVGFKPE